MSEQAKWDYALAILRPWVDSAKAIGSKELIEVMEQAEAYAVERLHAFSPES